MGECDWTVNSLTSQFVSLDNEGIVIFWSTQNNNNTDSDDFSSFDDIKNTKNKNSNFISTKNDFFDPKFPEFFSPISGNKFGRSPGGKISLLLTKIINRNLNIDKKVFSNILNNENINNGVLNKKKNNVSNDKIEHSQIETLNCTISVLSPVPSDISTLLISGNHGKVSKIVRFGEPNAPKQFTRPDISKIYTDTTKRYLIYHLHLSNNILKIEKQYFITLYFDLLPKLSTEQKFNFELLLYFVFSPLNISYP